MEFQGYYSCSAPVPDVASTSSNGVNIIFQAPDGMIFPDRATLYVCAIEDRQYKDEKINCTFLL